jgi:hypothetical protein
VKAAALLHESLYETDPGSHEFRRFMAFIEEYTDSHVHVTDMVYQIVRIEELLFACHAMSEFEMGNGPETTFEALDEEINRCVVQIL